MNRPKSFGHRLGVLSRQLAAAAVLMTVAPQYSFASKAMERCKFMDMQLTAALKTHKGREADRAAVIGTQARKLCSSARPALGLRTYIKAFRALGIVPKLPDDLPDTVPSTRQKDLS